ncbi:MAG: hypothetical protein AB3X46_08530 [Leptothrix ochracea]
MKRMLICAAVLVSGCTHYVPVVTPALRCEPAANLLQGCERPGLMPDGSTYEDLLRQSQTDRQNLQRCALQHADLVQALAVCNEEIERHNQALTQINPKTGSGKSSSP